MTSNENLLKKMFSVKQKSGGGVFIAFIILVIILSVFSKEFLTVGNLTNVLRQSVYVSIIVFGATFVMAMGGIDLSVGSTLAISSLVVGDLMLHGVNVYLAIVLALLLGGAIGLINGLLIDKVNIAPFISTMAVMTITRGAIMVYTQGVPKAGLNQEGFQVLGQGYIGILPVPVVITMIVFAIAYFLLNWTRYGRYTLSIGSNSEASKLVGINISKIRLITYALTGFMAALSGILLTSRMESAMPTSGEGYELDVIAASVIGGTSLSGGKTSIVGTAIGAIMMAVVKNGLNLLRINTFWHKIVIGVIILIAVSIDSINVRRKQKV